MPAEINKQSRNKIISKSPAEAMSSLNVFDRLEVGPVKLEPRRLIAPYRLHYNGKVEQTELVYTYEESVFDPAEPESQNLAAMIAAQVALNYGLFCDVIEFHGPYDDIDQRFIPGIFGRFPEFLFERFGEPA